MKIEFKRLPEVSKLSIIELMNHPDIGRHMPLLTSSFNMTVCEKFIANKEKIWEEYGYGPWAFVVDNQLAGWGGLQPENGEVDLAIVLHPDYWGIGKVIYATIIKKAFYEMGLKSVTVLLPPSRTRVNGLMRLGFKPDGELEVGGKRFIRYRKDNTMIENKLTN